jgi:hypothetical protein
MLRTSILALFSCETLLSEPTKDTISMQSMESSTSETIWHDRVHDQCREVQHQLTEVLTKIHSPAVRLHRTRLSLFNAEELQVAIAFQMQAVLTNS